MPWTRVLLFASFACLPIQVVHAQQFDFPHLITSGQGEVSAKPDKAEVVMQVVASNEDPDMAKQQADKVVMQTRNKLSELGIEPSKIHTGNLSVTPQMQYPKQGPANIKGYQATRRISVEVVNLASLPAVLEGAMKSGVNRVNRVQLGVTDTKAYQQKARLAATQDAQQKAKALAQDFGKELGSVWQIKYQSPSSAPMMRAMSMDEGKASTG